MYQLLAVRTCNFVSSVLKFSIFPNARTWALSLQSEPLTQHMQSKESAQDREREKSCTTLHDTVCVYTRASYTHNHILTHTTCTHTLGTHTNPHATPMQTHTNTHKRIHTHTHTHTHTNIHTHAHTHINTHKHTQTNTPTHTHTCETHLPLTQRHAGLFDTQNQE